MPRLLLAVLLAAMAAPAFLAGGASAGCDAVGALSEAKRGTQDDAESGGDAPDLAQKPLLLQREGYFWATLDLAGHDGADHDDWYAVKLPGSGAEVMVNVTSNYTALPMGGDFGIEVYAPGAQTPFAVSDAHGKTITFVDDVPGGLWRIHVTTTPYVGAPSACQGSGVGGTPTGLAARPAQNHGIYFGCNPVCFAR